MPDVRALARRHALAPRAVVSALLTSPWHEERMLALLVLMRQYARGTPVERRRIAALYLRQRRHINNWDLIDVSAGAILGQHWADDDGGRLRRLASSTRPWDRRLAVLTTSADIQRGRFDRTFALAVRLLRDPHDLVQKAVGWMLREIGKRDPAAERAFLDRHAARMPRTMLRYAIERLPARDRRRFRQKQGAT